MLKWGFEMCGDICAGLARLGGMSAVMLALETGLAQGAENTLHISDVENVETVDQLEILPSKDESQQNPLIEPDARPSELAEVGGSLKIDGGNLFEGLQQGFDNFIMLTMIGELNAVSVTQIGTGNTLEASIIGNSNFAAVTQLGNGHVARFTQSGTGNRVEVVQNSW